MPRRLEATIQGEGLRVGIAVARFNQAVTDRLLDGAVEALLAQGVADDAIDVVVVPGAFELPTAADALASSGRYHLLVCLGAVVRGETPHFDFVAGEAARGVGDVSRRHGLPVAFGVLTTDTIEQALARAGGSHGNKGHDAAMTALEMAAILRTVERT